MKDAIHTSNIEGGDYICLLYTSIPVEVGATVSCELTDGTPAEFVVTDVTDQYCLLYTSFLTGSTGRCYVSSEIMRQFLKPMLVRLLQPLLANAEYAVG